MYVICVYAMHAHYSSTYIYTPLRVFKYIYIYIQHSLCIILNLSKLCPSVLKFQTKDTYLYLMRNNRNKSTEISYFNVFTKREYSVSPDQVDIYHRYIFENCFGSLQLVGIGNKILQFLCWYGTSGSDSKHLISLMQETWVLILWVGKIL